MQHMVVWSPGTQLEAVIQQVVENAMIFYHGNKTATANSLGIAVRTLDARLEKYAAQREEQKNTDAAVRNQRVEFLKRQRAVPGGALLASTTETPSPYDGDANYIGIRGHGSNAAQTGETGDEAGGVQTERGVFPQSSTDAAGQSAVSVPERAEIQGVLSKQSTAGSSKRSR